MSINPDTPLQPFTPEELKRRELEEAVYVGLGELSSLFMKQEVLATQIVMPAHEAQQIGVRILKAFDNYVLDQKSAEISLADTRLKDEFGEDWLAYRDARLEELANERNTVR